MEYKHKITPSKNAALAAADFLKSEMRKLFDVSHDNQFWNKIDDSIDGFSESHGEWPFWALLGAFSDMRLNTVFSRLSDDKYVWKLDAFPVEKLRLTGMGREFDKYTLDKYEKDPKKLMAGWKKDQQMKEDFAKLVVPWSGWEKIPIFVTEREGRWEVFDGMHRVLFAIQQEKATIKAWAGYLKNPNGLPMITHAKCWLLDQIYRHSKQKDAALEEAVVRIGKEIIATTRNGEEILERRIAGWSRDKDIKRIFAKMLEK